MQTKNNCPARIVKLAQKNKVRLETVRTRINSNWPEEILFVDPIESAEGDETASDYEAWIGLTPEQLETMREFEQLGRIAKC